MPLPPALPPIGAFVCHDDQEAWGEGVVTSHERGYAHVFFRDGSPRKFSAHTATRLISLPPEALPADDLLRRPEGRRALTSRHNLACNQMDLVKRFLRHFPGGFDDPQYRDMEDYKREDLAEARLALDRSTIEQAVAREDWPTVMERVSQAVQRTNLVYTFENMRVRDLIRTPSSAVARAVASALVAKGETMGGAVAELADGLKPHGANKWTVVSWLACAASVEEHPFIKPTAIQSAAQALSFDIEYRPHPGARTWGRVVELYDLLRTALREQGLQPRDMLDISTLLWYGCGLAEENISRQS